jgi:hypothetical protein
MLPAARAAKGKPLRRNGRTAAMWLTVKGTRSTLGTKERAAACLHTFSRRPPADLHAILAMCW